MNRRLFTLADIRIETKTAESAPSRLVPFVPNPMQQRCLDDILPGWRSGQFALAGLRELLLKARQFGFSTLIAVLYFLEAINHHNVHVVVIAHDTETTIKLFAMVDRMYKALPEDERPKTQRANKRELYWPELDSTYEVLTAGTETAGRGWTLTHLHCSEAAFWRSPEAMLGVMEALPRFGSCFIESTANGEGHEDVDERGETELSGSGFHVDYVAAKEGRSPFNARFFAWFENPEYAMPVPPGFERTTAATREENPLLWARFGDETELARRYSLTDQQLAWRRWKITQPRMSPAKFRQEYPSNDIEAFRAAGKKFFGDLWDPVAMVHSVEIKPWWTPIGGQDWGINSPFCFHLGFVMDNGGVYVAGEAYGSGLVNARQAEMILTLLQRRGVPPGKLSPLAADPAMWAKKGKQFDGLGKADVEDFWAVGLPCSPADNARVPGWSNMRSYMAAPGMFIVDPSCEHLIRNLPLMISDPHALDDVLKCSNDHAPDCCRYMLNSRPMAGTPPVGEAEVFVSGPPDDVNPWSTWHDEGDDDGLYYHA